MEQLPDVDIAFKSDVARRARRVKQERENRALTDIFGDVLLRVVGTHLLLVDVFLEDIAEDIGVDFVIIAQRTFVKVPLILFKER